MLLFVTFIVMFTALVTKRKQLQLQPLWPYKAPPNYDSFIWTMDCKDDAWIEFNLR